MRAPGYALLTTLLLPVFQQPALAWPPERDLVAVQSVVPGEGVAGQAVGEQVVQALRDALVLVRGGEPMAARPGLVALGRRLQRLQAGQESARGLPGWYRSGGQLWLPARVENLWARLDAPDLLVRPPSGDADKAVGTLSVRARRIAWLPVADTARRLGRALPLLGAGESGRSRGERLLQQALDGVQARVALQDRPAIVAYYRVEEALAAAPRWDQALRNRLRSAAQGLAAQEADRALARRVLDQADRLSPSVRDLQGLALDLHTRIERAADAADGAGR